MSLTLHFHPFASYCHKALVALYENETPFTPFFLDLGDAQVRADFAALWPIAKMPVLVDDAKNQTIPEATLVIEYLALHYPGKITLVPKDAAHAFEARRWDRFFDLYVQEPMQKIVGDALRPGEKKDPFGVDAARAQLGTAYDVLERQLAGKTWATGDDFTMADCAAAPALFYANKNRVRPFTKSHPAIDAYFRRLCERPSFARVLAEAEPYAANFPLKD